MKIENIELAEAWDEFKSHRKAIKKPITTDKSAERIFKSALKKANGDEDELIRLIYCAIDRGWQGVFWVEPEPEPKTYPKISNIDEMNEFLKNADKDDHNWAKNNYRQLYYDSNYFQL